MHTSSKLIKGKVRKGQNTVLKLYIVSLYCELKQFQADSDDILLSLFQIDFCCSAAAY